MTDQKKPALWRRVVWAIVKPIAWLINKDLGNTR